MSASGSTTSKAGLVKAARGWTAFETGLRKGNRHVPIHRAYFKELLAACLACSITLRAQTMLYRGRIMPHDWATSKGPFPLDQMGPPPHDRSTDGRVNPAGIPCFYGAFEDATAIAELRPWPAALITIATFAVEGDLSVLDLRLSNPLVKQKQNLEWCSFMISRPVHQADRLAYVGSQYLAERLKAEGVRGLLYGSQLNPKGTNVALFDFRGLRGVEVVLYKVTQVKHNSRRV